MTEREQFQMLTWREIQDRWDKGVLSDGEALEYLGDLLQLIALQAPQLLDEATKVYYRPGADDEALPPTERADL